MKSVLAIAAHPDDIEFLMAGTLMRLQAVGYQVHYLNVANGCCGATTTDAAETARIRREEGKRAAAHLNAVFHDSLCDDLAIFYDRPTLAKVASIVRAAAPEIVLTHAPSDYMEDHMNACRLAVTAAFSRGMPNFSVDPPREPVSNMVTVYHAQPYGNVDPLRQPVQPEIFVDVSDLQDRKKAMLAEHASQKQWLDVSQGLDSYLHTLSELDRQIGAMTGRYAFAEGWRRHLHAGFCGPNDDPLTAALAESGHVFLKHRAENK